MRFKGKFWFHTNWILVLVVWAIIPVGNNSIAALTKLIAEIWECGNITKKKTDGARIVSSQETIRVLNKPSSWPNLFGRETVKF